MSAVTFTDRHDEVVRALVRAARRYDITSCLEPTSYIYAEGKKNRPDVTFFTLPRITIDVSIVFPKVRVGVAAEKKRKEKIAKHKAAVTNKGHIFVPFVMEVFGHFDQECLTLIKLLAKELPSVMQRDFTREAISDVSTALMCSVAATFSNMHLATERAQRYFNSA